MGQNELGGKGPTNEELRHSRNRKEAYEAGAWTEMVKGWFVIRSILRNVIGKFVVVQSLIRVRLFATQLQHGRLPCPSPSPRVCSNPRPLSQWFHPTISSPVTPFSSCPQSFPASGSFPVSWLFTPGGQSIRASSSASVLPMNIQVYFPLGLTGLILLFRGLSIWKLQGFSAQPSLWSNSHICT